MKLYFLARLTLQWCYLWKLYKCWKTLGKTLRNTVVKNTVKLQLVHKGTTFWPVRNVKRWVVDARPYINVKVIKVHNIFFFFFKFTSNSRFMVLLSSNFYHLCFETVLTPPTTAKAAAVGWSFTTIHYNMFRSLDDGQTDFLFCQTGIRLNRNQIIVESDRTEISYH